MKMFQEKQNLRHSIVTNPALQKTFKEILLRDEKETKP
jgi:hypothetical protein